MATAKKLPSGSWRCQVFAGYEIKDGKKKAVYKSFTVKDPSKRGKKECERLAAAWAYEHTDRGDNITVYDAVRKYINTKEKALSPSTVRSYEKYLKKRIVPIYPEQVSNRFRRAVRSSGCETKFRFHDLRHYYVSIAHALGVPDAYIMQMGGWKTDNVMHRVYRDTLPDVMQAEQDKMTEHFREVFAG